VGIVNILNVELEFASTFICTVLSVCFFFLFLTVGLLSCLKFLQRIFLLIVTFGWLRLFFFLKLGVHFYHMVTSIFDCSYIVDVFLCISCIFVKKLLILDGFSVFGSFSVEKEKTLVADQMKLLMFYCWATMTLMLYVVSNHVLY